MSGNVIHMSAFAPHGLEQDDVDLIDLLTDEAKAFLQNARALELSDAEGNEVCRRAGLKPFWPVPYETAGSEA